MGWKRPAGAGELPELQFASDILWGYWYRDNPYMKKLRVYGAHHVINADTSRLVARALKNVGKTALETWPGAVFEIGSEEFRVLIGKSRFEECNCRPDSPWGAPGLITNSPILLKLRTDYL